MLETVADEVEEAKIECVFADGRLDPLTLLKNAIDAIDEEVWINNLSFTAIHFQVIHLIHIPDNVSLNYLCSLLETFYSSAK